MKDRVVQNTLFLCIGTYCGRTSGRSLLWFLSVQNHARLRYLSTPNLCLIYREKEVCLIDADVENFFDSVSHKWLLDNVPLKKKILASFLKAGFLEDANFFDTDEGFPQESSILPVLANFALNGLTD
jgi:RNA-directed DNA polymerase